MGKKSLFFLLFFTGVIFFLFLVMQPISVLRFQNEISVLFPKGLIALEQRNLLLLIQVLMLFVILPVYFLTFFFSWRYRADNTKATYDPDLIDNKFAEYIWWGLPLVMTLVVGGITWVKTHELDPYKPIASEKKTITIQAVALQWKWLFIYPEEKVASVNFLQFPNGTPIHFEITADAPMNSFWIPHLAGQIYAMPNMKTELNLIADEVGDYRGASANLSGEGFAGMTFITRASTEEDYKKWLEKLKKSDKTLDWKEYEQLAVPSQNDPVAIYQLNESTLFHQIMMKYMPPQKNKE